MDTYEQRLAAWEAELREKYTQKDRDDMAGKEAMDDGSYPIKDAEDLGKAIKAVGRGGADHDAIRKHIIARAKALGASDEIPDNWSADGSLKQEKQENAAKTPLARRKRERHRAVPLLPEVRFFPAEGLEIREADTAGNLVTISGAPVVYNDPYEVVDMLGTFTERMHPGVASDVLGGDTRFLFNHGGMPLARTVSGTLTLRDTATELQHAAVVDIRQQHANDLVIAIERGDVTQMSVGFLCGRDKWNAAQDERDVYAFAAMPDLSAVSFPCSPTTHLEVAQRMALAMPVESRARARKLYADLRAGKVLSQDNQDKIVQAASAMHSVLISAGVDPAEAVKPEDTADDVDTSGEGATDDGATGSDAGGQDNSPSNADGAGGLRSAPATAAERREQSLSFGDQQSAVYQALCDHLSGFDGDIDLWICDIGSDWVIWKSYGPNAGNYRLAYTIDSEGVVTFGDETPVEVERVTSYVPVSEPMPSEGRPGDEGRSSDALRLELEAEQLRLRGRRARR